MKVSPHSVVTLSYSLTEKNPSGSLLEKVEENTPFSYIHGMGQLLPDFENNLSGLTAGSNFTFAIPLNKAYGEVDKQAIIDVPIEEFAFEGKLREDLIEIGTQIPVENEHGQPMYGTVIGVNDVFVQLDFNHPMAGKDLFFAGKVLDVRKATESEIDHGHVHGPGGHHHDH